jgi:hypothetical protein
MRALGPTVQLDCPSCGDALEITVMHLASPKPIQVKMVHAVPVCPEFARWIEEQDDE